MTQLDPRSEHLDAHGQQHVGHGGHRWMVIACCIPMLVIALVLVATGVANARAIVFAVMCTAMMAVMMAGMGHGGNDKPR